MPKEQVARVTGEITSDGIWRQINMGIQLQVAFF